MSRTIHVNLNLRGAITNFKKKDWKRSMTNETGRFLTPDECYQFLLDELSEGKKCIPIGECDNFDYQKGCLGHETPSKDVV